MATLGENSVKGTEFKVNVNMTPIGEYNMENVEWNAEVFTENGHKRVTVEKKDAIKVDSDNYLIRIDSAVCGAGKYYVTLTAYIPDTDFPDGFRTERRTGFTGVTIDSI